jgi:hypothetical protein
MLRTVYTPSNNRLIVPIPDKYIGTELEILVFPVSDVLKSEILLNPSPSNDPWFNDTRNMDELNRAVDELKTGKADLKEFSNDEITQLFTV